MSYVINKSNGEVLLTLIDGTADNTTSLTLIGKNFTGFGEQLNENFVKLLENFSGVAEPDRPLTGQLWYDTTEGRMKVYSGTGWKAAGGPIVQSESPLNFTTGDLWIDNNENQLWFFDGSDLILAGPIWKRTQGKTGFVAETLFDSNLNPKSVLFQYVGNSLIGIYSAEEFTPVPEIAGFTTLYKGYTANNQINSVINSTATNSQKLNNLTSTQFMRSDASTVNSTKILIQNNQGLSIGSNQIGDFKVAGTTVILENMSSGGDIAIRTNNNTGTYEPIYVDSSVNRVGIYTTSPTQTLDVAGNLRVRGDFIVEGDTTTVQVSELKIEDKNIELAYTGDSSQTDLAANGAGIIIKGTTDKTILYNYVGNRFDLSETINIPAGKVIKIDGVEILSATTLSSSVTSAPGITSVGPQIDLTVDDIYINNNRISSLILNQDIELAPLGTGNVSLIGSPKITGLADPTSDQDASTKIYTETYAKGLPISLSIIENELGGALNTNIISFLNDVANPAFFVVNKKAYVHIQHLDYDSTAITVTRSLKRFVIKDAGGGALYWDFESDLTSSI